MSKEVIRPFVKIVNKKHPHYSEEAMVLQKNVPLTAAAFLGSMDKLVGLDGRQFFARREDYKIIG